MDQAFGHWLAGFIDGEGSFTIIPQNRQRVRGATARWSCQFGIQVRDDDHSILEEILLQTGLGRCYRSRAASHRNPLARWTIASKRDAAGLVELLDEFPLRAKKARDFVLWREAVAVWIALGNAGYGQGVRFDWTDMERLSNELKACREYAEAPR